MLDDEFLKNLHHILLEVRLPPTYKSFIVLRMLQIHIEEGSMTCPNCKHVYPISNGIPNMVRLNTSLAGLANTGLAEHEIG
jgi:multifunctional methyltransferase subunit TRM112